MSCATSRLAALSAASMLLRTLAAVATATTARPAPLRQAMADTAQTGRSHRNVERQMTIALGDERREVVLRGSTSVIESTAGLNLLLTLEDITEQKNAEKKLQFQAMVLDQIVDRITVTDLEGRITYVNQAECETFGCSAEQLMGRNVESYGDDPSQGATQEEIIEATRRDGSWRGEVVNTAASGSLKHLDCRTQVVVDEDGFPVALCGIATDITEQRRAEEALAKTENRLRGTGSQHSGGRLPICPTPRRLLRGPLYE